MAFDKAHRELMPNEGGYSDNPKDPGGETMFGITKRVARANGYTGEMRDLTLVKAKEIAKSEYWDKYRCDELPYELAFQVFDAAYNGGHPVRWLQQAVKVNADGVMGKNTLAAIKATDEDKIILRFDAYRLRYMASLDTWTDFGRGWANRIAANMIAATED